MVTIFEALTNIFYDYNLKDKANKIMSRGCSIERNIAMEIDKTRRTTLPRDGRRCHWMDITFPSEIPANVKLATHGDR